MEKPKIRKWYTKTDLGSGGRLCVEKILAPPPLIKWVKHVHFFRMFIFPKRNKIASKRKENIYWFWVRQELTLLLHIFINDEKSGCTQFWIEKAFVDVLIFFLFFYIYFFIILKTWFFYIFGNFLILYDFIKF